ncbi:hypothetical protein [Ancylomarina sp. 16SWW S1-10-2]|uniref:hypothetical protein n=1 Tax=Ancylomarina sp. 16SWW S1-10-2 TaxID=2499681 RepID=UPI0012AD2A40|nr:hypothetical protein [Ancylomarina sp. 16SWW S1-10-2]MRT94475.1 hypothetical protein [Ancylomarina sp. 16SWW S1-10-2]
MIGEITFTTLKLIIDSNESIISHIEVCKRDFESIPSSFSQNENNTYYKFRKTLTNDFFALSIEYGKPNPHRDTLVNVKTDVEDENKRTEDEAELSKQSFLMYHFESKRLYLSNSKQIKYLSNILTQKSEINGKFIIQRLYKNFNDFIAILKSVDKIRFSGFKNLFNQDSREFKALEDLTGTSSPESFTLEASYDPANLKLFMRRLKEAHSSNKIEELMICGIDENGFESIYNVETFSRQFKIRCSKNKEGIFTKEQLYIELINKIEQLCAEEI